MKNAILFRFYKEPEICLNHLELLKRFNPKMKIYGLYGWPEDQGKIFYRLLGKYLDDFYTSPNKDSYRKRINGDLMIEERYKSRGKKLQRDSIFIIQRDMLVFASLQYLFPDYKKDQVYISWTKILNKNIEGRRSRTAKKERNPDYEKFKKLIKEKYGYTKKLLCSLFITVILPRKFLEKYSKLEDNITWFLEYKIPTYAKIFWLDIYKKDIGVRRYQQKGICPQNARGEEISKEFILKELHKKKWRRMFHPYFKIWDQNEIN